MSDPSADYDVPFYQLIMSLHASANQQLGKGANPFTGKTEINLEMAEATIGMLDMLKRKTEGNLSDDETKLLDSYLYQLRLVYLEENGKAGGSSSSDGGPAPDATSN